MSLCKSNDLQLEIQKKGYLKTVALGGFGFCAFDFEAMAHPSCYLTSIMDKTHHGPFIFSLHFSSFFSYVGGILVTKHFSVLLIDRYILAIQQIIAHEEYLRYSFWSVAIFWTESETLAP